MFFFVFFLDLSAKTLTVDSFSGRVLARTALTSRYFSWEVHAKVKKKHRAIAQAALGDCGDPATGSWIQYPGSRIRDPGSWVQDP